MDSFWGASLAEKRSSRFFGETLRGDSSNVTQLYPKEILEVTIWFQSLISGHVFFSPSQQRSQTPGIARNMETFLPLEPTTSNFRGYSYNPFFWGGLKPSFKTLNMKSKLGSFIGSQFLDPLRTKTITITLSTTEAPIPGIDPWSTQVSPARIKSHPSCSTKSYRCTCTPRCWNRGGTGAGRSSQRPSQPVMVRGASASATWWYTTTAPQGTIAAVHGMHQNVSIGWFCSTKKMVRSSMLILETSKSWRCRSIFLLRFLV